MIRQPLKFRKTLTVVSIIILLIFILLILSRDSNEELNKSYQKLADDFRDLTFNDNPKERYIHENKMEKHEDNTKWELQEAKARIEELEKKIAILEGRVPQQYPDVKFLGYKERKRILVTGGAGFVGSHLVDILMIQGHEVIVVDNFFTGRKRNVEHWFGHRNFEIIHHDIVNPLYVEADEIYHLASPASPPHYMQNPVKTIKTNTLGTINMLGLARRVGAKILIASTSEVYGDPMVHPQPESYWGHVNPIGPRACYDEGKRVAETLAYSYAKQENVSVRVARIFNTYGPRMHVSDGRVVSNFVMQALQNLTITLREYTVLRIDVNAAESRRRWGPPQRSLFGLMTCHYWKHTDERLQFYVLYGNGQQTRSFCYVSDLVDGLLALMASTYTLPVNIGNPVEHTIEEFAMIIKNLVPGCRSMVATGAAVEDDPQRRRPDIAVAEKHLKWKPKISLQDGLQRTIKYFREELSRTTFSNNQTYIDEKNKRHNN